MVADCSTIGSISAVLLLGCSDTILAVSIANPRWVAMCYNGLYGGPSGVDLRLPIRLLLPTTSSTRATDENLFFFLGGGTHARGLIYLVGDVVAY